MTSRNSELTRLVSPSILKPLTKQLQEVFKHPWVSGGSKAELELELPMKQVVQTLILPSEDDIDPDVLSNMTSLGCFKNRDRLVKELLNRHHNNEKVIYFLLLDRKIRRPAVEEETEVIIRSRCEIPDSPRKRIDTRHLPVDKHVITASPAKSNLGKTSSLLSTGYIDHMVPAEGSPIFTRKHLGSRLVFLHTLLPLTLAD